MAATPGELKLIATLQALAGGQAPGSFGPGQALALLVGFVKLRDRVDAHDTAIAQLETNAADHDARIVTLETWRTDADAHIADLEARVAALESPPPPA